MVVEAKCGKKPFRAIESTEKLTAFSLLCNAFPFKFLLPS